VLIEIYVQCLVLYLGQMSKLETKHWLKKLLNRRCSQLTFKSLLTTTCQTGWVFWSSLRT